jgi:hypothetical protein
LLIDKTAPVGAQKPAMQAENAVEPSALPVTINASTLLPAKRTPATAFKKGHQKFAGRRPGSKNKRTRRAVEIARDMGVDPIEFLLSVVHCDTIDLATQDPVTGEVVRDEHGKPVLTAHAISLDMKIDAAKSVAAYIHPKLTNTAITGADDGPIAMAGLDLTKLMADPAAQDFAMRLLDQDETSDRNEKPSYQPFD